MNKYLFRILLCISTFLLFDDEEDDYIVKYGKAYTAGLLNKSGLGSRGMGMGSNIARFNYSSPYMENFGRKFFENTEYKRKEILTYRVSSLYYYLYPDKTAELLKHLMSR